MHAIVVQVKIDPDRFEEAERGLTDMVVPTVKAQPGFVRGTWVHQRAQNRGIGISVYESEEAAEAAMKGFEEMRAQPEQADDPVTIESAEVYGVGAIA
jgi:quinol monooxygenase YgiN